PQFTANDRLLGGCRPPSKLMGVGLVALGCGHAEVVVGMLHVRHPALSPPRTRDAWLCSPLDVRLARWNNCSGRKPHDRRASDKQHLGAGGGWLARSKQRDQSLKVICSLTATFVSLGSEST